MGELNISVSMVSFGCCWSCGIPVCGPQSKRRAAKESGENFYCTNGHSAVFGESEVSRLQKQLEVAQAEELRALKEKEWAQQGEKTARQAEAIAKGKLKAQTERVKNGVCPCCNRSFINLRRHMATKHPELKAE